jgi:hypothetical protein
VTLPHPSLLDPDSSFSPPRFAFVNGNRDSLWPFAASRSGASTALGLQKRRWWAAWSKGVPRMQDAEGKQNEKAERLRFGRFFYRFPNGESGADVYDRMTVSTANETPAQPRCELQQCN